MTGTACRRTGRVGGGTADRAVFSLVYATVSSTAFATRRRFHSP